MTITFIFAVALIGFFLSITLALLGVLASHRTKYYMMHEHVEREVERFTSSLGFIREQANHGHPDYVNTAAMDDLLCDLATDALANSHHVLIVRNREINDLINILHHIKNSGMQIDDKSVRFGSLVAPMSIEKFKRTFNCGYAKSNALLEGVRIEKAGLIGFFRGNWKALRFHFAEWPLTGRTIICNAYKYVPKRDIEIGP